MYKKVSLYHANGHENKSRGKFHLYLRRTFKINLSLIFLFTNFNLARYALKCVYLEKLLIYLKICTHKDANNLSIFYLLETYIFGKR